MLMAVKGSPTSGVHLVPTLLRKMMVQAAGSLASDISVNVLLVAQDAHSKLIRAGFIRQVIEEVPWCVKADPLTI